MLKAYFWQALLNTRYRIYYLILNIYYPHFAVIETDFMRSGDLP